PIHTLMKPRRMLLREPAVVALQTMRAHKLRSFLMLLGIVLSVSTLIIVVALIEGTNQYIANTVANMGSNVFLVQQFPLITDAEQFIKARRRNKRITCDDFEPMRAGIKLCEAEGGVESVFDKLCVVRHSM